MKQAVKWVVVLGVIGGAYFWLSRNPAPVDAPLENIVVPQFSALAAEGEVIFNGTCAACHGVNIAGTERGPSLLRPNYRPRFHADYAIRAAVQNGVTPHHWQFGAMPPQDQIGDAEVERLIAYIRELQRANGLN